MQVLRPSRMTQMKLRFSFIGLHVLFPLLAGGLIYICWRDPTLLMFRWFSAVGLSSVVNELRASWSPAETSLPRWVVYSLPDGLWVYAVTAFLAHVWRGSRSSVLAVAWISLGVVIGAGSELGQMANIIPGSFDRMDFLFSILAAAFAIFLTSRTFVTRSLNAATA